MTDSEVTWASDCTAAPHIHGRPSIPHTTNMTLTSTRSQWNPSPLRKPRSRFDNNNLKFTVVSVWGKYNYKLDYLDLNEYENVDEEGGEQCERISPPLMAGQCQRHQQSRALTGRREPERGRHFQSLHTHTSRHTHADLP